MRRQRRGIFGRVARRAAGAVVLAALVFAAGCATERAVSPRAEVTADERAAMQTRQIDGTVDTVLAAAIDVLQDKGWTILKADRGTGLLQAETARRMEALGPAEEGLRDFASRQQRVRDRQAPEDQWTRWECVTLHVEPFGGQTRLRMVMIRRGSLPSVSYDKRVEDGLFARGRLVQVNVPAREESCEVLFPEVYADWIDRIVKAARTRLPQP